MQFRYNFSYTATMKTAISIPDPLFQAAERVARRLGVSRSRMYAQAVEAFVRSHQSRAVRQALDEVYGAEPSEMDPALQAMQLASLPREDW